MNKRILDVTCGDRGIWFDKQCQDAIYCDKRMLQTECSAGRNRVSRRKISIIPDVQCDFTNLPFDDESFALVIFDPPHLKSISETAWLCKKYSRLSDDWPQILHDGFAECMRVLKPDGVLVFKWSELEISTQEVIKAIGHAPLFGHHSGRKMNTHWMCFMKERED